jgi:hypothetical protein
MKHQLNSLILTIAVAVALCGCGKSESEPTASPGSTAPAAPATPAQVEEAKKVVTDLASQLVQKVKAGADEKLGPIATDLASKVNSLSSSLGANETVKAQLDSTLQSLLGGMDAAALGTAFKVVEAAKLTPEQVGLAKEVGNLASAFVVQRNFASLDGAQGDVATLVNSLRKGEVAAALAPLQKITQNANLTATQKDLLSSLADQYAPALKNAAGSLQQGLQNLKSLPGVNK